jgi:hypothetical protein
MSKRFPIPEFDRDLYKNMSWEAPTVLSPADQADKIAKARAGDASAYGCYAVDAPDALYERFKLQGPHRRAILCLVPPQGVKVVGRSWAWEIQRAVILDSLDPAKAKVLQEWKTSRPMNTRLGPDSGVELPGGPVYVLFGHLYGDHWIANRAMQDRRPAAGRGLTLVSSSDESSNDFHACHLAFSWS